MHQSKEAKSNNWDRKYPVEFLFYFLAERNWGMVIPTGYLSARWGGDNWHFETSVKFSSKYADSLWAKTYTTLRKFVKNEFCRIHLFKCLNR